VASREQAHLAHDLYDGLGQQLTGIALFLRGLGNQIVRELPAHAADFKRVSALVSQSIEDTRLLASGMSPIGVERAGLAGALTALSAHAKAIYGLQVLLEIDPLLLSAVESRVASHLYRIVQEALGNIMKHAQATEVNIRVKRSLENVILTIEDNGRGFMPDERSPLPSHSGFGLTGMGERARLLGGELKVRSTQGKGTTVLFEIPLRQKQGG